MAAGIVYYSTLIGNGVQLLPSAAPAATNAYVNYDGTNVVVNAPSTKGIAFAVNGTNVATISATGKVGVPGTSSTTGFGTLSGFNIWGGSSAVTGHLDAAVSDGSSAVAWTLNNIATFSTTGAKLLSVQNNGVEKASIDLTGAYSPTSASSGVSSNPFFGYNGTNVLINAPSSKAILGMVNSTTFPFRGLAVAANDTTLDGQFEVSHLSGGSGAPTSPTLGTGCGAAQSGANNAGSDLAGQLGGTCGSAGTGGGAFVTITFAHAFNTAPRVVISPLNSATAALSGATQVFPVTTTTTLAITAGATAPPAGTYLWSYMIVQ